MTEPLPLGVTISDPPGGERAQTLVFLHGYGASSFSWRTWLPTLEATYRTVVVDLKGFGSAPRPLDDRYAPADQAELVHRLILDQDLHRLTLIGHSLGGGIALKVAQHLGSGGRLSRLVLVAGAAYRQRLPPFARAARHPALFKGVLRVLPARTLVAQVMRTIVYDPGALNEDQIAGYAAGLDDAGVHHALFESARQVVPADLDQMVAGYPEIRVPTLLLWGRQDRVIPLWVGERLLRDLPDARLAVLERCGHLPAEERPLASLRVLLDFLEQTGGWGSSAQGR